MKSSMAALLLMCTLTLSTIAIAQTSTADVTDMQALRAAVKADKRAFVAATLALTDAQAKKFWPAYDEYQRKLDAANRIRAVAIEGLLSRDKPITDLYAKQLAAELVESDEAEVKARRTLYSRLMRALPATKAARYLQLESKVRAIQNYDLAVAFPLIK
jgi:Spy/CpxP family protein refolding chaperone